MSETVEPTSHGSYDDVPDEHVATVLNVPLRLSGAQPTSARRSAATPSQVPPGQGRHRKPDSPVEVTDEHVVTRLGGAEPLPPPRRRTSPPLPPAPSTRAHDDADTHWRATLKVGTISAAIVFGAAALTLVVLTWLP